MAARVWFREIRAGDLAYIAANLREADKQEITASRGEDITYFDALDRAVLLSSHTWVATSAEHEPIAIFGVAPISLLDGLGSPWFLSTDLAYEHPRALVSEGRRYLAKMRAIYPNLYNYVDARNDKSIRWLKRLGFDLHPPEPYGPDGMPFHKFEIKGAE